MPSAEPRIPLIRLAIPDGALRAAVAEQLTIEGLGDVHDSDFGGDAAALIIDESALDKKIVKILGAAAGKACILLLGATSSDITPDLFTETFPKPLRLGHLVSRLRFYLETAPRLSSLPLSFGPYRLESHNRQVVVIETGAVIRLTEKETALLEYLGQSSAPVPREELLAAIWGYDARIDTHTLETHIYQLRRKLDPDGNGTAVLLNEQGTYRLDRSAAS
jgi:hypothetical protein